MFLPDDRGTGSPGGLRRREHRSQAPSSCAAKRRSLALLRLGGAEFVSPQNNTSVLRPNHVTFYNIDRVSAESTVSELPRQEGRSRPATARHCTSSPGASSQPDKWVR